MTRLQVECVILERDCRDLDRCAQDSVADYVFAVAFTISLTLDFQFFSTKGGSLVIIQ